MPGETRFLQSLRLHIRSRPGMYIGGADARGLGNLLVEIMTKMPCLPGASPQRVRCKLGGDGSYAVEISGETVGDVDVGHFEPDLVKHDWLNDSRFCLAIASAMSARMDVEIVRDGKRQARNFAEGLPTSPLEASATTALPFLRLSFQPDPAIFKRVDIEDQFLTLCGQIRDSAAFHPTVRFSVERDDDGQRRDFHYPNGLRSLAHEYEFENRYGVSEVWHCQLTDADASAEAVLLPRASGPPTVHAFVNWFRTLSCGTHVEGLRAGVADVAATFAPDDYTSPFWHHGQHDPLYGFVVLIAVQLKNPDWRSSTRAEPGNPRAVELVRRMIVETLPAEIKRTARPGQ
jgi:DNA gyrase/topoisomerase IV subunit B